MSFFTDCIKGIAIGAGAILPGISSGVLCVIFGIYEKLLDSILNFFKDVKRNLKFLLPIILGIFIGVICFSNILNYLFFTYPLQIKSIFIGLILGSIPSLFKEVSKKQKFRLRYLLFTLFAFVIGLSSVFLEKTLNFSSIENLNFLYLIFCGFAMSIGVIVPGVSSTIILMLLGVYSTYLTSVSNLYFPILIPIGIGLILGSIIFMKLTKFLLNTFYAQTFYTIIGFTLGSIIVLIPDIGFDISGLICILCINLGFYLLKIIDKS